MSLSVCRAQILGLSFHSTQFPSDESAVEPNNNVALNTTTDPLGLWDKDRLVCSPEVSCNNDRPL